MGRGEEQKSQEMARRDVMGLLWRGSGSRVLACLLQHLAAALLSGVERTFSQSWVGVRSARK